MLIQKTNPAGIDSIVDFIQVKLDANAVISGVAYDNLPRAYKNPAKNETGFIPELYIGNGNYTETLMNDKVILTSFFIAPDSRNFTQEIVGDLSLIVQCSNLGTVFPNIAHRADEELIHLFLNVLLPIKAVQILNIETSIDVVFREFERRQIKFVDMGRFFVFRINMNTHYAVECCSNC